MLGPPKGSGLAALADGLAGAVSGAPQLLERCLQLLRIDIVLRGLRLERTDLHARGGLGGGRLSKSPVLLEPQHPLHEEEAL
eukprot:4107486-Alexandrium_andersonii.AAC.1